jgi:hypothetical protein
MKQPENRVLHHAPDSNFFSCLQGGVGGVVNRIFTFKKGLFQRVALEVLRALSLQVYVTPPTPPCEGGENSESSCYMIVHGDLGIGN